MSTQRYISTSFWDDEWIQSLDPSEKLLYLYLMTNPLTNIAGIYKITMRRISFDTGFNNDTISHIMRKFQEAGKVYRHEEYIIMPSWPKHQRWQKSPAIKNGIESILSGLTPDMLELLKELHYAYPMGTPTRGSDTPYRGSIGGPTPPIDPPRYSDTDTDTDTERDIEAEIEANLPKKKKPPKNKYGPLKNVYLTEKEYSELYKDFGPWNLEEYLKKLSYWKPNTKTPCYDDNARIRKWMEEDKIPRQTPENIAIMEGKE